MVKPGAGTGITQAIAQVPPTSSVNQRTSKLGRPGPVAPRNAEGSNAPIEARESRQDPTSKRYSIPVEHTGSESSSKPGFPWQDLCPVCSENPARITQMEKNPGLVPSSEVITALRQLAKKAAKARSTPPDSSSDSSDTESSQASTLLPTPTPFPKGVSNTGAQPMISTGLEISEVPVEAHGEGSSSSESSTEDESEGDGLTTVTASVNVPSAPVHLLEDQITALIRGPKHLDEIPSSSSESEGETSPEDLVLDEEEDLSRQPLHKQLRALSTTRPSSIEPEHTSEDEADSLMPVYMDTSHEVPDRSQKNRNDQKSTRIQRSHSKLGTKIKRSPCRLRSARSTPLPTSDPDEDSRAASPESDATAINNTDPAKSPILASAEQQTGRVLVPPSSPIKDGGATNTKEKALSQDADDDVESTVETPHGDQETDPIEPESTQSRPPSNQGIDPASHDLHRRAPRTALNTPTAPEQPSRRSGRLANRRFSMSTAEDLVPLAQVRHKVTLALKSTIPSAKDNKGVRDDAEDATREKRVLKQVGKSGNKSARSTTRNRDDSGCETSPSVAREDGSPRAPVTSKVKRTTSPPSEKAQQATSSVVGEIHTSSQGPPVMPPPGEVGPSATDAEAQTPVPSRRSAMTPSQKKKGDLQPLFFPGSSQVPRALSPSRSESENESETAVSLPRKTPTRSTPGSVSRYRLLSELASKNMFSKSKAAQQRLKNTPMQPPRFDAGDDREDDDEDSSSSSDDATLNSHIPKERRAGAARKKRQGLSSLGT
ncbi:hypothetical protein BC826DRAFT_998315 [Russula brevipes]|nr:hypothetical protein BC826DRAFT_998315 [Russula brevipes]